jgi:hypothetical protein
MSGIHYLCWPVTVSFLLLGFSGEAQEDSLGTTDSIPKHSYRNEIGVSIAPLVLVLFNADPYSTTPVSVTYKRVRNSVALRVNFSYRGHRQWMYGANEYVYAVDSMYRIRKHTESMDNYIGRIGAEYRKAFASKVHFVCGADLQFMYSKYRRQVHNALYQIDSSNAQTTSEVYYFTREVSSEKISDRVTEMPMYGLGISLGLMVPVKKHWWILGQMRADAFFGRRNYHYIDNSGAERVASTSIFDFEAGPPLSELSVFYRF